MSAHRYWRVFVHINNGGANLSIAELQLRAAIGGSDVTGSGTASVSSEYSADYNGDKAFDNNVATAWVTANSATSGWIKYDFGAGSEQDIKEFVVMSRDWAWATDSPKHFELEYSDDDTAWFPRISVRDATGWGSNESRTYNIDDTKCDFVPHYMSGGSAPAPYVATASSFFASLPPWHAFDGLVFFDGGKYWATDAANTGWLKMDLGSGNTRSLHSYQITHDTIGGANRAPKAWTMQGSNDDSSWDDLDSQSNQTGWGAAEARLFTLAAESALYRYYRLNITENNGDTYLEIGELSLFSLGDPPVNFDATWLNLSYLYQPVKVPFEVVSY